MLSHHLLDLFVIHFVFLEVLSGDAGVYSAVVVEYSPYLNASLDAEVNILNNVRNYVNIIKAAASGKTKADIIVFPESSLIGYLNKQKLLYVPDPKENCNPCTDAGDYETPLVELSCAARTTRTYVVVNLSEKYHNSTQQTTHHFNTNVAFDRNGCVVARYRKIHLYGEGDRRPSPDKELVYFDTDFGVRFGLLTCFDIIFKNPGVDLAREHNVSHFIFTSAWFSQMPFLTAIQEQYYWAYSLDVCLLAAGYNMPSVGSTGSGIYLGRQGPLTYAMAEERNTFTLQAYVPKRYPSTGVTDVRDLETSTTKINLPPQKEELNRFFINGLDLLRKPNVLKTKQDYMDVFSTEIIQPPDSVPHDHGVSRFTIPFKVNKTLCHNSLCCTFSLRIKQDFSKNKEDVIRGDDYSQLYYRLAVFDGVKTYNAGAATGGLQTCAIIPCITRELDSCGLRSDNLSAVTSIYFDYYQTGFVFESIEISGNLSTENSFVGPNILLKGKGQSYGELLLPNSFVFANRSNFDKQMLFTLKTLKSTIIVTASLYGRVFSRDGSQYTTILTGESSLLTLNIRFDITLFIVVTLVIKYIIAQS